MADFIEFDVDVDGKFLREHIDALCDDVTMQRIHNLFAKLINPWVPMYEGILSQALEITAKYIRYKQPYAHYMYDGEVYGPNIPIWENGIIVGWWSPPGKGSKHPTGRAIKYGTEKHPLATKEWDKVALPIILDKIEKGIINILALRARELYGS